MFRVAFQCDSLPAILCSVNICYFLAGRSVWWKAGARGRGQHFQARGHRFFLYGPTLSRPVTYIYGHGSLLCVVCERAHLWVEAPSNKQPNKLSQLQNFNYSDFHCHLKVNRDKHAFINRLWKCKKFKRLTITANSFTKIDELDGVRPL